MSVRPLLELIPDWEAFVGMVEAPNVEELKLQTSRNSCTRMPVQRRTLGPMPSSNP